MNGVESIQDGMNEASLWKTICMIIRVSKYEPTTYVKDKHQFIGGIKHLVNDSV
jgi:hypothetical protein